MKKSNEIEMIEKIANNTDRIASLLETIKEDIQDIEREIRSMKGENKK
jgi:DnaJ-domain-containing protein 1